MKEKMLGNAASRKSPTKLTATARPLSKTIRPPTGLDSVNVRMDTAPAVILYYNAIYSMYYIKSL